MQETRFDPWVGKTPWGREWQPTPVCLPGEPHRQRSLVSYSPWGRKESDTTEVTNTYGDPARVTETQNEGKSRGGGVGGERETEAETYMEKGTEIQRGGTEKGHMERSISGQETDKSLCEVTGEADPPPPHTQKHPTPRLPWSSASSQRLATHPLGRSPGP